MAVGDIHPGIADLEAFTLGTLDDASLAGVEAHVADCPICQERAAGASGDTLVELLRRVHAQAARRTDTVAEAAAQARTPAPVPVRTEPVTLARVAPAPTVGPETVDFVPGELARHERYRVVRLLGEGGMGSVYEAEHRVMQRPVALKVINRAYTAKPAAVARFRREVRAAARLAHPNIVTTYDAEDAGNTLFLVMEYVEGVSLARLVKERGPLPVAEACAYVRQAVLGLQHAHERGMVHRDVKPDNLICCEDGTVKVLDFGLAALTAERGDGLTDTNAIMGTPDYMAPEQAEDARSADIRADVYSLGCTLYYLLTGNVPYPAATPLLKILAHRDQPLPAICEARPDVPPQLPGIMVRLLAKKSEDRYQTPGEVAAALEVFASDEKPNRQGDREPRRKRGWLVAAAVLFIGLVVAGAIYRIQTDTGELIITTESDDVKVVIKQGGKQVDLIDTKTDKQIALALRSGTYELELKGAPEGLKLNIDKATLTRGKTVLARIERAGNVEVKGKVGEMREFCWWGPAHHPALGEISADGRLLLASGNGARARLFDLGTGQPVRDLDTESVAYFTSDGKRVVALMWNWIRVLNVETGAVIRDLPRISSQNYSLRVSPSGRHALTWVANGHSYLWDLETGKELHRWDTGKWRPNTFTADAKQLVLWDTSDSKRSFRLWNVAEGTEFPGNGMAFQGIFEHSFLTGGKEMVIRRDGALHFHDVVSGKTLRRIELGPGLEGDPAISRDGRLFLCPATDGSMRLWDLAAGRELRRYTELGRKHHFGPNFSADGRYAAIGRWGVVVVIRLPDPPATKDKP